MMTTNDQIECLKPQGNYTYRQYRHATEFPVPFIRQFAAEVHLSGQRTLRGIGEVSLDKEHVAGKVISRRRVAG